MNDDTEAILGTLRAQAWERAKGELQAALATFHSDKERFTRLQHLVSEFVKTAEDEGLAE